MMEPIIVNVYLWGSHVGAMTWNENYGYADFEFTPQFRRSGLEISPLIMPLANTRAAISFPTLAHSHCFNGLPGLVADSLPDNFGNQLINEWFEQHGRPSDSVTPLERLCYVGSRAMGALEYKPAEKIDSVSESTLIYVRELMALSEKVFKERSDFQERLRQKDRAILDVLKVGTSAGGAKPKAIIAYNELSGEVRSGQVKAPEGYTYWLLKFDGGTYSEHNDISDNPKGIGNIEYAYYKMAVDCGIKMSECRLLSEGDCNHFMTKRFDRLDNGEKVHMQTLAGLAHLDRDTRHSYEEVFSVLRRMNMPQADMTQLYRRMVFNVIARNHDDHTKNFSFLMDKNGKWQFAPAYDLCYSYKPGGKWTSRHQLSVNGKQQDFTKSDLLAVAEREGVRSAVEEIEHIEDIVSHWTSYAREYGVKTDHMNQIEKNLLYKL